MFSVPRHPGLPQLSAEAVLRSGFRNFDWNARTVSAIEVTFIEGRSPETGGQPVKGWLFNLQAGLVFLPSVPGREVLERAEIDVAGYRIPGARLKVDAETFGREITARLPTSVVVPFIDIVEATSARQKRWFTDSSYLALRSETAHGARRDVVFQVAGNTYEGAEHSHAISRWEQELQGLALQVVSDRLGGDAFVPRLEASVRAAGHPIVKVERRFLEELGRGTYTLPRLFDGPEDALRAVEDETCAALEALGHTEGAALAALFLNDNGWDAMVDNGLFARKGAVGLALDDRIFATALLDRWQPTFGGFLQFYSTKSEAQHVLWTIAPDTVAECGRREQP